MEDTFTFFTTGTRPERLIKGVIEAITLTATVFTLYTAAATENITYITLAALSARVGTIQGSGEVRAGGRAGTCAHLVMAVLRTWQLWEPMGEKRVCQMTQINLCKLKEQCKLNHTESHRRRFEISRIVSWHLGPDRQEHMPGWPDRVWWCYPCCCTCRIHNYTQRLWGPLLLGNPWKVHRFCWWSHSSLGENRRLLSEGHTRCSFGCSHLCTSSLCPLLASCLPTPPRFLLKSHQEVQDHPRGHRCSYHKGHRCCWSRSWVGRWMHNVGHRTLPWGQNLFPKQLQPLTDTPW